MLEEFVSVARFDHPKNITIGQGRIIWAPSAVDTSGIRYPEGWALPGGARTTNEIAARAAAVWVDGICSQGARP